MTFSLVFLGVKRMEYKYVYPEGGGGGVRYSVGILLRCLPFRGLRKFHQATFFYLYSNNKGEKAEVSSLAINLSNQVSKSKRKT